METAGVYKTESKKKKKSKPSYIGYIDTDDDRINIIRKATGRDLYRAVDPGFKDNSTCAIISFLCCLEDKPLSLADVEELDSGLSIVIREAIMDESFLKPINLESYPKQYELITNENIVKQVELVEKRKIKHDNECLKLSFNYAGRVGFWLINKLVKIDGEYPTFEQIMNLPASEVETLMELVTPKKYTFTPTT